VGGGSMRRSMMGGDGGDIRVGGGRRG